MQWVKKYWDQNYPGGEYDPLSRREKGAPSTVTKSSAAAPSVGRTSAASKRATKTPGKLIMGGSFLCVFKKCFKLHVVSVEVVVLVYLTTNLLQSLLI